MSKKLTHENIEKLINEISNINHEDAIGDEVGSISEAFHSGFATALMVVRLSLRGLEE